LTFYLDQLACITILKDRVQWRFPHLICFPKPEEEEAAEENGVGGCGVVEGEPSGDSGAFCFVR